MHTSLWKKKKKNGKTKNIFFKSQAKLHIVLVTYVSELWWATTNKTIYNSEKVEKEIYRWARFLYHPFFLISYPETLNELCDVSISNLFTLVRIFIYIKYMLFREAHLQNGHAHAQAAGTYSHINWVESHWSKDILYANPIYTVKYMEYSSRVSSSTSSHF